MSSKSRLTYAERTTIDTLTKAGVSQQRIADSIGRNVKTVSKHLADARQALESNASAYVELHKKAAEKAAERGDSRPSEWMMERTGIVKPVDKGGSTGPSFQVVIGVKLPGLGQSADMGVVAGELMQATDSEEVD
jgi:IS30 family transposase